MRRGCTVTRPCHCTNSGCNVHPAQSFWLFHTCASAMSHCPTALIKKYRCASHNQSKSWLSQALQVSRTLSNIKSWHFHQLDKLNHNLTWFVMQIHVDFHFPSQSTEKGTCTYLNSNIQFFSCSLHMKQIAQVGHHCNWHWIDYPFPLWSVLKKEAKHCEKQAHRTKLN